MLENWNKPQRPDDEEIEARLKVAREKLSGQQMKIKEHGLPVLVLFEGWGTAGKGSVLGKVIRNIDPRFFKVATMDVPTEEEKRKPFLYRHFVKIPEKGKFMFLDSGWMDEITQECLNGTLEENEYKKKIESVKRFERQLTDNGYLVMKFFFQISQKEQKKRIDALKEDKNTKWRVSGKDDWQNKHYEKCMNVFDRYLNDTNAPADPWYLIDAKNKKWAELQVLETLVSGIDTALKNSNLAVPLLQNVFPIDKILKLEEIDLDKKLTDEEYRRELHELQQKLTELHNKLYRKKVPVIIAYEGWDAAGKGGNIKRIAGALDPRGFEVHPIASPEPHEKARHYLWRFWNRLPKTGHVAILTVPGTEELWLRDWKVFAAKMNGREPITRLTSSRKNCLTGVRSSSNSGFKSIRIHSCNVLLTDRILRKNSGKLRMKIGETGKNGTYMKTLSMR